MMASAKDTAIIVGDLFIDLFTTVEKVPRAGSGVWGTPLQAAGGGTGGNIATALSRLGVHTRLLTAVGDDEYGRRAIAGLEEAGVDTSLVRVVNDTSSGVVVILVDAQNERTIIPCALGSAYEKIDAVEVARVLDAPARHLLISGVALGAEPIGASYLALAEQIGDASILYFDPNLRQPAETIHPHVLERYRRITELADVVMAGREEIDGLGIERRDGQIFIEKSGASGCHVTDADGRHMRIPAHVVECVDSTGAGDAFAAGFIAARARGMDTFASAHCAATAGALTVASYGARIPMTWDQVTHLMKGVTR